MTRMQAAGVLLWRGGLLLAAVAGLVETMRWLLRFIDVPREISFGLGMFLAGFALFVISLIAERVHDIRVEGGLSE